MNFRKSQIFPESIQPRMRFVGRSLFICALPIYVGMLAGCRDDSAAKIEAPTPYSGAIEKVEKNDVADPSSGKPRVLDGDGEALHNPDSAHSVARQLDNDRSNELQTAFTLLDDNGDGRVTPEEWGDQRRPFTGADLDNDGVLVREEYLDAMNDEVVSDADYIDKK